MPFARIITSYKLFLFTFPVLMGLIFIGINYKRDLAIYPDGGPVINWATDKLHRKEGRTETHFFSPTADSVTFSFTQHMGGDNTYPYALAYFRSGNESEHFDFTRYDYIDVELKLTTGNSNSKNVLISFETEIPGYSNPDVLNSDLAMLSTIAFNGNRNNYRLYLNQFETPYWWWEANPDLKKEKVGKPDYSKVTQISIGGDFNLDVRQDLIIYKIVVGKDIVPAVWKTLIFMIFFYGIVFALLRKQKSKTAPYKKLEVGNRADEEIDKVVNYIAANYNNPSVSIEVLQRALGMSERRISGLLKSFQNTTFKRYLNQVRLQQARRLLSETDKPINVIAIEAGYSNVTHFNRIFKLIEGRTPNEYRKLSR